MDTQRRGGKKTRKNSNKKEKGSSAIRHWGREAVGPTDCPTGGTVQVVWVDRERSTGLPRTDAEVQ
jgi:hypothetical protein